jgi:hypothetical protein
MLNVFAVDMLGNAFPGISQYNDFLSNLPSTSHEVQSFDCHPIPGNDLTNGMNQSTGMAY